MSLRLSASALTHVGCVRQNNEDNFYLQGHIREDVNEQQAKWDCTAPDVCFLAAVADGMGGEAAGELASLTAVRALRPSVFALAQETLQESVTRANDRICEEIRNNGGRRMGSTLAALFIDEGKALCGNIGDSRCYRMRGGTLTQLSTDHNKARRMVELGVLTPEQAAHHRSRHELTRHLGIFEEEMVLRPTFCEPVELREGDVFLLCSDGLNDVVTDEAIAACLSDDIGPEVQASRLVQLALEGGGRDNITVVVIRVQGDRPALWQRLFARPDARPAAQQAAPGGRPRSIR